MPEPSLAELFQEGELSVLGSNNPLLLQGSENIWFIKSGDVDVFSVQNDGTEIKGARVYLFSLSAGCILFGMDSDDFPGRSFLAVGNKNVNIYKLSFNKVECFIKEFLSFPEFAALLDKWISSLTGGVARDVSLRYDIAIEKSGGQAFPANKKIRAKKGVLWLKIEADNITLLDSEINNFSGTHYFPVTDNCWSLTVKPFTSEILTTSEFLEEASLCSELKFFHDQVRQLEELNVRMLMVDDFVRNKEKIEILKKVDRAAWNNIAGVLDPSLITSQAFTSKDPLFEACRILGEYQGIEIQEPSGDKKKTPGLKDIAQTSKFEFRKIALNDLWWKNNAGPLLAFCGKENDPAVLIPGYSGKYKIKIPSRGIDGALTPELISEIGEYAYSFYRPFPFKNITPLRFLKFVYKACRNEIALLIAAGSIGGLLTLFLPLLTGIIIDSVIPQGDRLKLYGFGLAIIFSSFALIIAQVIRSLSYIRLDTKIDSVVFPALWDRLINLPVSFFKRFSSGALASKANSIPQLKQVLTISVLNTFIYNLFLVFNLFLLYYFDALLGLFSTLLFAVFLGVIFVLGLNIKKRNHTIIQLDNRITSLVNQVLNSISKIKIAGVERLAFKLWTDKYSLKQTENISLRKDTTIINVLNAFFPVLALVFIYTLFSSGSYKEMSAGTLISFLTAFNVFLISIVQISSAATMFFGAIPLYDNSREILSSLPEYAEAKEPVKDLKGEIEISHLYFRYSKETDYILSDICMSIRPGEFIAVVGTSGSGKSTLMRMLLGFESPEMGAIYYDRHDIESIDKSSLRRRIGTVMQNSRLFPGNIYSNIAGVENIPVAEINEIARIVGLDEDLKTMPMGVYTFINEGISTLSGGQRQKILIAKAIVMKPTVLLLDEATSALDNESQTIVTDNLARIQATRIIVAHRLSTVKNADRIYVLEKGRIAECGTYEELLEKKGLFLELVQRQIAEI